MTKEEIKSLVIVFLESNTDENNLWIDLKDLYLKLGPEILKSSDDISMVDLLLINSLEDMFVNGQIRIDREKNNKVIIALEENIQNKLNVVKKSAIDEMEEILQKYVKEENYEKAAEYRDMINMYKEKSE